MRLPPSQAIALVGTTQWTYLAKLEQGDKDKLLVSCHHNSTNGNSRHSEALQRKWTRNGVAARGAGTTMTGHTTVKQSRLFR